MKETIIATLINLLNITPKDFAQAIGASTGNVHDWVSGRTHPSKTSKEKICSTFHISKNWLNTGEGNPFSNESEDKKTRICKEYELKEDMNYSLSLDEEALIDIYRELNRDCRKKLYRYANDLLIEENKNKRKSYISETTEINKNIG